MLFEKIQLESDEQIIKIVHKHWFIFFVKAVGVFFVTLMPLIAWIAISVFGHQYTETIEIDLSSYTIYFLYFYLFWILLNWMTLAHMWTTYYLDIWVVTNKRIIVINQESLFRRQIGSFRLERLQDININISGIIATFLNYGTIEAETASGGNSKEFKTSNMPKPRELKATILKASDSIMSEHSSIQTRRN